MLTTLQALAHAPMGLVELAILTGRTEAQVFGELVGLRSLPIALAEVATGTWSITELGRITVREIEAYESGQRRDAACVGRGA